MNDAFSTPVWYRTNVDWSKVTDEEAEAMKMETEKCIKHNNAIRAGDSEKMVALLGMAKEIFGPSSNAVKYLKRQQTRFKPTLDTGEVDKRIADARKRARQEQESQERSAAQKALIAEATLWLTERGKTLGNDFTGEDAVQIANQIAFQEEVDRKRSSGNWHDFDGQNCEGPCRGWDGESHRCDCGNRRVSWSEGYGHSFKDPWIHGEAH